MKTILALAAIVAVGLAATQKPSPPAQQWEFTVASVWPADMGTAKDVAAQRGLEGWELVAVTPLQQPPGYYLLWMKRPLQPKQ